MMKFKRSRDTLNSMTDSDDEDTKLMHSLSGIRRLHHEQADIYAQKPRPQKRRWQQGKDVLTPRAQPVNPHLGEHTSGSWFDAGLQKKLQRRIKMGQIPIDAMLDLHGYRQQQALEALRSFLHEALNVQARMLLIIHGKGFRSESQAVLRPLVQHWLIEQSVVLAFCPAQPADGGSGASYVYIKNR